MPETVKEALAWAASRLKQQALTTAALDARLLLQHATGFSHADLIAGGEQMLTESQEACFRESITRRARFEPVSRIMGEREFYGRSFIVTRDVLDPRPDTETLIDVALAWGKNREVRRLIDLGTGSGVIALTLLAEWAAAEALATDRSPAALEIAGRNAKTHGLFDRLRLLQADWWSGVTGRFDLILSNPPYISEAEELPLEVVNYDPHQALFAGSDGLSAYRHIAKGAVKHLASDGRVLVEIGQGQIEAVKSIFISHGLAYAGHWLDIGGVVRVLAFDHPLATIFQKNVFFRNDSR